MNKERLLEALYRLSETVEHEEHNAHEANGVDRAIRLIEEFQEVTVHDPSGQQDKTESMAHAERIRHMTDRELAELITSGKWSAICPFCHYYGTGKCRYDEEGNDVGDGEICVVGAMEWLQEGE